MANTRTIQSPGVEIREVDLSTRAITPVGTNVLVAGFAPQGPTYEIVSVTTPQEFQAAFGTPTNAAERYFYYSVNQLLTNGGGANGATVSVARLPYGDGAGEGITSQYSALAYPVMPIPADTTTYTPVQATTGTIPLSSAQAYYLGEPALVTLTEPQYTSIIQGGLTWATTTGNIGLSSFAVSGTSVVSNLGNAGLIVLNQAKTSINEKFEGYYFSLGDSWSNNPATPYDDATQIKSVNSSYFVDGGTASYTLVPTSRIGFALSAASTSDINNLSRDMENIPTFNIAASGFDDVVVASLFRVRPSPFSPNVQTLQYVLQEGYTGSFYVNRQLQDPNGGTPKNIFLNSVVDNTSNVLNVLINPNISSQVAWLDNNGNTTKKVRMFKPVTGSDGDTLWYTASAYLATSIKNSTFNVANNLYALGVYSPSLPAAANKNIGDVGAKLSYILNLAENPDIVPLDITVDAGLSTIYAATQAMGLSAYDDTTANTTLLSQVQALSSSNGNPVSNTLINAWTSINNQFVNFASGLRKDHVFISDPLRHIFVTGANYKTLSNQLMTFSQNIYWPLRNSYTDFNTSYGASYPNWVQIYDQFTSQSVWLPSSGYAAAVWCSSDAANYKWTAPAGLNRGVITGLSDLAINPNQKQRDLLYKISLNPIVYFPNDGYVVWGQKTLLTNPNAFDRLNVRRLFLYLEKATLATCKSFVFEPNTTFTRSRVVNTLSPVFTLAKNTEGLYDYLLVCNTSNNTPDVIDDNTLVVDIYIKPVRTAEFILVNFYATKTSQNFKELVQ